jgi:hypothetical protein
VWIEKPGSPEKRPLGIPAERDRIVQGALRHVLEPIFERDLYVFSVVYLRVNGRRALVGREVKADGCEYGAGTEKAL